ncbi:thiamine-monophosphate kinase [Natronospira proteinivora]|uniref:Thiamine-monophosphate kinase n=1 Tax=Natronospira proteinivora TaxID=1807133 RepID=A0ABT1G763_9GAMM|nr:thiamine-phosphate kinase [Natronospira proteinivora]MCP1727138.1 thiamine-monophosphate kinase [Natronospira proteinivora]
MSQREFDLIQRYFRQAVSPAADLPVGIGDDGAVVLAGNTNLAWVMDTINEDVHFPHDAPGAAVGHRALAVNLSDMVAMGAQPRWMLLSLCLPEVDEAWLADFSDGLLSLARDSGVTLAGGDTTRGPLSVAVTLLGPLHGQAVQRSGARPGDRLLVSGTLGDARAGLDIALGDGHAADAVESELLKRYLYPQARLALSPLLARHARAAIDLSDGLVGDLTHLLSASGVGATIHSQRLPRSRALMAHAEEESDALALSGGDDYEILCAVAPEAVETLVREAAAEGIMLSDIGEITQGPELTVLDRDGQPVPLEAGFSHFGDDDA